jgi:hypothetical protein
MVTLSRTIPILPAPQFSCLDRRLRSGPERPLDGLFSLADSFIRIMNGEIGRPAPTQYQGLRADGRS